ncbi:MAG: hypothetical protein AAF206_18470 [Bacteroidota bacterium]
MQKLLILLCFILTACVSRDQPQPCTTCFDPNPEEVWESTTAQGISLYTNQIRGLVPDSNDQLFIVQSLGYSIADANGIERVRASEQEIFCVSQDPIRLGGKNILVTLDQGNGPFFPFDFTEAMTALLNIGDDRIFAGGEFGRLVEWKNGKWQELAVPFDQNLPLEGRAITALAFDEQQQLWVGTKDQGFFIRQSGVWSQQTAQKKIAAIELGRNGLVFVADEEAGLFRYQDGGGEIIPIGLNGARLKALFLDERGRLWIGSDQGVRRIHNALRSAPFNVDGFDINDGLLDNEVQHIYVDGEDWWFGGPRGLSHRFLR